MKKIDNFFNKHDKLIMFIWFMILAFIVRKDKVHLAAAVGMCGGYYINFINEKTDKIISFIKSKVFKK